MAAGRFVIAESSERESGGVPAKGAHVFLRRPLRPAPQKDSSDWAGEGEVSDLGDNRDRGKARVDVLAEDPFVLAGFDGCAKSLEKTGREGSDRRFGMSRFPVDQLAGQQKREMRIRRQDSHLALDDRRDDVFWL